VRFPCYYCLRPGVGANTYRHDFRPVLWSGLRHGWARRSGARGAGRHAQRRFRLSTVRLPATAGHIGSIPAQSAHAFRPRLIPALARPSRHNAGMDIKPQHIGVTAFATLAVITIALIVLGLTRQQLPEWLLAFTTFL